MKYSYLIQQLDLIVQTQRDQLNELREENKKLKVIKNTAFDLINECDQCGLEWLQQLHELVNELEKLTK